MSPRLGHFQLQNGPCSYQDNEEGFLCPYWSLSTPSISFTLVLSFSRSSQHLPVLPSRPPVCLSTAHSCPINQNQCPLPFNTSYARLSSCLRLSSSPLPAPQIPPSNCKLQSATPYCKAALPSNLPHLQPTLIFTTLSIPPCSS